MRRYATIAGAILLFALAACGGGSETRTQAEAPRPTCPRAWRETWQRLARQVAAPVYCPSWLPDPLTGEIGGPWNNIHSVDRDRSYLMGFTWYEVQSGEIHVNLRGYPGRTAVPRCHEGRQVVACFADSGGRKRIGAYDVTVYTSNHGADSWHVLYAWKHRGSLYTLSEHVAPPYTYGRVIQNMNRMLRGLERIDPKRS